MPSKPTDKCPYPSIFSPGCYVHFAQLVAEKMCQNAAKKEYKELPLQFWEIPKWSKVLKFQLVLVARLRRKYRDDAIMSAINDKRCRNVFSLSAPWFIKIIDEYQALPSKDMGKSEVVEIEVSEAQDIRPTSSGNNLASLLD